MFTRPSARPSASLPEKERETHVLVVVACALRRSAVVRPISSQINWLGSPPPPLPLHEKGEKAHDKKEGHAAEEAEASRSDEAGKRDRRGEEKKGTKNYLLARSSSSFSCLWIARLPAGALLLILCPQSKHPIFYFCVCVGE